MRSTDPAFLELIRGYLGAFRVEDEQTGPLFSAHFGEDRVIAGGKCIRPIPQLFQGAGQLFRGRSPEEMAGMLIARVKALSAIQSSEFVRLGAGAVAFDGGALIISSMDGASLPTLIALLVRGGAGYLGDEMVNLDPVLGDVHPLPLPPLVDVSDMPLIPGQEGRKAPRGRPWTAPGVGSGSRRIPVPVEELGASGDPAPPRWIVFPSFEPGGPTSLERLGRAEALFTLVSNVLDRHIWGERAPILLRRLVDGVATARIAIGSLPDAADLLIRHTSESAA